VCGVSHRRARWRGTEILKENEERREGRDEKKEQITVTDGLLHPPPLGNELSPLRLKSTRAVDVTERVVDDGNGCGTATEAAVDDRTGCGRRRKRLWTERSGTFPHVPVDVDVDVDVDGSCGSSAALGRGWPASLVTTQPRRSSRYEAPHCCLLLPRHVCCSLGGTSPWHVADSC
jgi:hypothetical protein